MEIEQINEAIQSVEAGKVSDGYHTFDELYEHRIAIYMALCAACFFGYAEYHKVWMSKTHSDGTVWPSWFILGINEEKGKQITYHLPMYHWDDCKRFAIVLDKAPEYDGHTPADVLERLADIYKNI